MNTPADMTDDIQRVVRARAAHFHPLEVIPWFRRFKYSIARDLLYTFIWSCILGLGFTLFAVMFSGGVNADFIWKILLISNVIGYCIHFLFMIGGKTIEVWILRQNKAVVTLYYTAVSTVGVITGYVISSYLLNWNVGGVLSSPGWYISIVVSSLIISIIIAVIYYSREQTTVAEMRLERERLRMSNVEREATLANLRTLQAQIEPHFLFNTLANVVSLIHPDPHKAKHMLESFIQYLRASLTVSRESGITLSREFEFIRNLLSILQIRMGERLKVSIDLPDDLADHVLPPMLIQPLVENAIKHGLEPKVDGGLLTLSASRGEGKLRLVVADTGLGFNATSSSGVGLHNVRERIAALYGDAGRLIIEDNSPSGTRVILEIPETLPNVEQRIEEMEQNAFSSRCP